METLEEIQARHRKEVKDLTNKTTAMKKSVTKGEKKKRKDIMKQVEEMEADLKRRHQEEVDAVDGGDGDGDEVGPEQLLAQMGLEDKQEEVKEEAQDEETSQPKRRNRRKEKLAKRQAEEERMREEADAEWAQQPDLRKIELENLEALCKMQGLRQYDITPDGHCLYASISDQLKTRHGRDVSVQELRTQAANHIRENRNTFAPFMFDEETMTIKEIEPYCDELENTAIWGGDMEILALANVHDCCISVMFSGRSTHKVNEDGSKPELKLVYYKHSYGLGEHYNSLRDAE